MPSEKKESDYDDDLINNIKSEQLDDLINNIKSKQSKDLVNKKIDDIVNNIGNKRLDSADIDLSPDFDSLRKTIDKINKKQSDQIDYDKLEELVKVNSELSRLQSLDPLMPVPDLSSTRKSNIPISTKKPSSKVLDNVTDNFKISGPGPGTRFTIRTKELDIENDYDNIKYLENKSHDTSFSFDEHSKILNNIIQIKKYISKKEKELDKLKKDLEKKPRTDQARSFKDQNKELSGNGFGKRFDISAKEFDIKNDYNNIIMFNYMLKDDKLTPAET